MAAVESLTLRRVRKAIVDGAKQHESLFKCEHEFAELVEAYPSVLEARLRRSQYTFKMLHVDKNCTLADLGSGIGLTSVLALMCGAKEVYAIEREDSRFRMSELIIDSLQLRDRIHLCKEDLLKFELPRSSIDGAFSAELLEHIADLPRLYRTVRGWLKPHGRIYARTGANGRCWIKKVFFFKKAWDKCDQGYLEQRKTIIRSKAPDLSPEQIANLADRTRGLLEAEVEEEVNAFCRSGEYPDDGRPCAPRDPYTGEYMERDLDAFATASQIDREGFTTTVVRPDFSSLTTLNPFKRFALRTAGELISITHPLSLNLAPWLEFVSIRNEDGDPPTP